MDRRVSFRYAGCATLPPSLEESLGSPEFPTLPWCRAPVFDPDGFAGAMALGPSDVAFRVANHVGTHN